MNDGSTNVWAFRWTNGLKFGFEWHRDPASIVTLMQDITGLVGTVIVRVMLIGVVNGEDWDIRKQLETVTGIGRDPAREPDVTPVVFRKWKDSGDIIALLPEYQNGYNSLPYDRDKVMSYMHVGQHSEASYSGVISQTVRAIHPEYDPLYDELKQIGYKGLRVHTRRPRRKEL